MPFSNKYKIFFIHIPKCGGSSIENFFGMAKKENLYFGKDTTKYKGVSFAPQHFTPELIKQSKIGAKPFDEYLKFTFIRNPYDRVISEYYWLHQNKMSVVSKNHFYNWLCDFYEKIDKDHKLSQTDYVIDPETKKPYVDFLGRVENFKEDFNNLLDVIDFKGDRTLKRYGKTKKKDINFLTNTTKKYIEAIYKEDFENFNY